VHVEQIFVEEIVDVQTLKQVNHQQILFLKLLLVLELASFLKQFFHVEDNRVGEQLLINLL
jgi:hypothetical protein